MDALGVKRKNLVFTSAGDNTHFDSLWLDQSRTYDVGVVYYGSDKKVYQRYKSKVDYIEKRKGSKFQNFNHIYNTKDLSQYDRFFILDDDIVISTAQINEMFKMSEDYGFWICAPSFDLKSKISHRITKHNPGLLFRYTNYIEVNTPLFTRKALDNLMELYDPILIGWGIDHLYIWANGWKAQDKYAIIDAIQCTNPHDRTKGGRELHKCKEWSKRAAVWRSFEKENGIPRIRRVFYKRIALTDKIEKPGLSSLAPFHEKLYLEKNNKDKIAFMFLTVDNLRQPELIYDFLNDGKDRCTIYAHSKYEQSITQQFLLDAQISDKAETKWGGLGLVKATNLMLKEALKDPTNKYFILLSESCIPLYSFNKIYDRIYTEEKSWIQRVLANSTVISKKFINLIKPAKIGIKSIKDFYLCSQWMILSRKHAEMAVKKDYTDTVFKDVNIPDECYYINVIKYYDKEFQDNIIKIPSMYRRMLHKHPMEYEEPNIEIIHFMIQKSKGGCLFGRKVGHLSKIPYQRIKAENYIYKPVPARKRKQKKSNRVRQKLKKRYGYIYT